MPACGGRQGIVQVWMACSFEIADETGRLVLTVLFSGIVVEADEDARICYE